MRIAALLALAAVALAAATSAQARRPDECADGYSYAGAVSPARGYGVSASLKSIARPTVAAGHVAAWVGVGGAGLGPGGSDEWLQAGIAEDAGGSNVVYYEYKRPGDAIATYVQVGLAEPDHAYRIVVYERLVAPGSWRVMIDGVKVSDPVVLPGSHGAFAPVATAESWDGGVTGVCNGYAFDFSNLAVRTEFGRAWKAFELSRVLRDPAYDLRLRASGFVASAR